MARREKTYQRLPGRARRRFGLLDGTRCRLWLADDHLLHVCAQYYSESYKRFELRDIQAITVSRTTAGRTANILLAAVVAMFALLGVALNVWMGWSGFGIFFGSIAGLFGLILSVNALLGPTCVCRLHTAVQVEELYSLGRLRTAKRALDILKPLIEKTQGQLTPEQLDAYSGARDEVRASAHALPDSIAPAELKHEDGKVHSALFYLVLIVGISAVADVFFQHALKNLLDMALFVSLVILLVLALRRQRYSDLPRALKAITWTVLGVLIAAFLFSTTYGSFYFFNMAQSEVIQPPKTAIEFELEGPVYMGFFVIKGITCFFLAMAGLLLLSKFQSMRGEFHPSPDTRVSAEG